MCAAMPQECRECIECHAPLSWRFLYAGALCEGMCRIKVLLQSQIGKGKAHAFQQPGPRSTVVASWHAGGSWDAESAGNRMYEGRSGWICRAAESRRRSPQRSRCAGPQGSRARWCVCKQLSRLCFGGCGKRVPIGSAPALSRPV